MSRQTFPDQKRRPDRVTRETMLKGMKESDPQAWQDLYDHYWHWLLGICLKTGVPYDDAQDLVQKVFIKVNEHIKDFVYDRSRGRFSGWLVTILGNLTIDYWRRQPRDVLSRAARQTTRSSTGTAPINRIAGAEKDQVTGQVLANELNGLFQQAYAILKAEVSPEHWRIFEAYAIQDRPANEVAAEAGLAVGSVYCINARLMARLRQIISRMLNER